MENNKIEDTKQQVESKKAKKSKEKQPHEKKGIFVKSKTTIGVASVVVSLLVATLIPTLNGAFNSNIDVVRAKANIAKGTKITANMLKIVAVGKTNLPNGTAVNPYFVIGKYASTTITQDDDITANKISSTNSTYKLKNGEMLMSVPVASLSYGVAGKLQAGDIVSVYVQKKDDSSTVKGKDTTIKATLNPPELKYVKIVAVSDSNGKDTNTDTVQDTNDTDSSTNDKPGVTAMATFIVNNKQAKTLVGLDGTNIHFALCCRDNVKLEKLLLAQENRYLTSASKKVGADSKAKKGE